MKLQTNIPLQKELFNPIDYNSKLLLLGSCFSENIEKKLSYFKFDSVQNPFGILFHPKAIEKLITNAMNEKVYSKSDVFYLNEVWQSFDAHSQLNTSLKEEILATLNSNISRTHKRLKESTHIVITLGTAWVYRHIESDSIVANCHKVPQKKFLKELLSVDEITESLESIVTLVKDVNATIQFLFTVSPVRHLKDGFIENQQSKSHLISAIHQILEPRKNIHYFPSYEIMMDELRDYRFYADDMIHPNKTAINYIWEKFSKTWISDDSIPIMERIEKIQKGLQHKPFQPDSEKHQHFLHNLDADIQKLPKNIQARF